MGWTPNLAGRAELPPALTVSISEAIETVSPEGPFCDTAQVPSGAGDMQLI